jgi:hypothetical protein
MKLQSFLLANLKSWGWLYLIVSVLLLVLLVDYYINQKYADELELNRKSIAETIGIIPRQEPEPSPEPEKPKRKEQRKEKQSDTLVLDEDSLFAIAEMELIKVRETDFQANVQEDILLADSLFSSIAFGVWEERLQSLNIKSDSMPTDTAVLNPILRGLFKKINPKSQRFIC